MWTLVILFFTKVIAWFRSNEPSQNYFAAKVVTISLLAGLLILFFIGIRSCTKAREEKRLREEANAVSANISNAESTITESQSSTNVAINTRKEINTNISTRKTEINKSKSNINAIKNSTPKPINGRELDNLADEVYP